MAYAATSPCISWSAKQYILAALAGTLILTAVAILVSVALTPAAVRFSIAAAPTIYTTANGDKDLSLILTANNTSHRAGVKYRSVIVSFLYTDNSNNMKEPAAFRLHKISPPLSQSPGSTASINVSAFLPVTLLEKMGFTGGSGGENATPISVLLDAIVQFKYGRVYTRSYEIRVLCEPTNYLSPRPPRLPIMCNDD